jgi:group I intron endonuclease
MSRSYESNKPPGGWPPQGQGCVYLVTNRLDGKQYVGVSNNLKRRWHSHCAYEIKCKSYIKYAIHAHGYENFAISILMLGTKEECMLAENDFIEKYNTLAPHGYNLRGGGEGVIVTKTGEKHPLYGRSVPEEQRKKISAKLKGRKLTPEHVENMKRGLKSVVRTPEWRRKIGEASRNRVITEETRKKIGLAGMGRKPSAENCANQSKFLKEQWKDPAFRDMMIAARRAGKEKRLGATL